MAATIRVPIESNSKEWADNVKAQFDRAGLSAKDVGDKFHAVGEELDARKLARYREEVKRLADEIDTTGKAEKLREERSKKFGQSLQSVNAALQIGKATAGAFASAVAMMSERGVPAFQQLSAVGSQFREKLMEIGESKEVQMMMMSIAETAKTSVLPAMAGVGGAIGQGFNFASQAFKSAGNDLVWLGAQAGVFSKDYAKIMNEDYELDIKMSEERKRMIQEETDERRKAAAERKKIRDEELLDPGKKLNEEERLKRDISTAGSDLINRTIERRKADAEEMMKKLRTNEPDFDVMSNPEFAENNRILGMLEARKIQLKNNAMAEIELNKQLNVTNKALEGRKKQLEALNTPMAADEKLNTLIAKRNELEKERLGLMDRVRKNEEEGRQFRRDREEKKALYDDTTKHEIEANDAEAKRRAEERRELKQQTDEDLRKQIEERKKNKRGSAWSGFRDNDSGTPDDLDWQLNKTLGADSKVGGRLVRRYETQAKELAGRKAWEQWQQDNAGKMNQHGIAQDNAGRQLSPKQAAIAADAQRDRVMEQARRQFARSHQKTANNPDGMSNQEAAQAVTSLAEENIKGQMKTGGIQKSQGETLLKALRAQASMIERLAIMEDQMEEAGRLATENLKGANTTTRGKRSGRPY